MTITRSHAVIALAMTGALALGACGTDANKTSTGGSGAASTDCPTGTLKAEGSSAQKAAIEAAITSFQTTCTGATVNYAATGSGAGIKQFIAAQVDFGGTDSALKDDEAASAATTCAAPAWHLPMVTGPVGVAYNLPSLPSLVLNADVTAKIFLGQITMWNDPALAAINPGVTLPDKKISVFFRSDDSGTTDNFTKYLKAAAGSSWTVESGKKWNGTVGEGKPQNAGVATAAKGVEGSIAYLEWSYITQNKLGLAKIDTGSGPVELTSASVGKMIETAKQKGSGNDLSLTLDYATKTPGAYPINLVTYEVVCSTYKDPAKGKLVKAFLTHFSSVETQKSLESLGYAPLPASIEAKVQTAIAAIG